MAEVQESWKKRTRLLKTSSPKWPTVTSISILLAQVSHKNQVQSQGYMFHPKGKGAGGLFMSNNSISILLAQVSHKTKSKVRDTCFTPRERVQKDYLWAIIQCTINSKRKSQKTFTSFDNEHASNHYWSSNPPLSNSHDKELRWTVNMRMTESRCKNFSIYWYNGLNSIQ